MTYYITLSVFSALSLVHLAACLLNLRKLRMLSKIFLMPLLALCWLFSSENASMLVFWGIILGGLGDIGMLWPLKKKSFFFGMLSFFLGHLCYLGYILLSFSVSVNTIWLISIPLLYLTVSLSIYIKTRRSIDFSLRLPCFLYMLALSSLSCLSLLVLITEPCIGKAIAFAGASFFLISDAVLSQALFIKKSEPPLINFIVMLTYILAQALLALGWSLI